MEIIDKSRFADLVPERLLNLDGLPPQARTAALESAYESGFTGCFLPDMEGPLGRAARYLRVPGCYFGTTQDIVEWNPAVLQDDRSGITGANTHLVFQFCHLNSGAIGFDYEGTHPRTTSTWIYGRPDNHQAFTFTDGFMTCGHKNFFSIKHPFIGLWI